MAGPYSLQTLVAETAAGPVCLSPRDMSLHFPNFSRFIQGIEIPSGYCRVEFYRTAYATTTTRYQYE